jgi:hypothetical protein
MKDPLEERLERMRPSQPSPELLQRLLAAEPDSKIVNGPWRGTKILRSPWLSWAAAAAAIVLGFVLWPGKPRGDSPKFAAFQSSSYLVSATDVGVVAPQPDHPFRLVHCVWVEDDALHGSDPNSSVRMTQAREQIVPVAMETY